MTDAGDAAAGVRAWRDELRAARAAARDAPPEPEPPRVEDAMPTWKAGLELPVDAQADLVRWLRRWTPTLIDNLARDSALRTFFEGLLAACRAGSRIVLDVSKLDQDHRDRCLQVLGIWAKRAEGEADPAGVGLRQLEHQLEEFVWPGGRPASEHDRKLWNHAPAWSSSTSELYRGLGR